MLNIHRHSLLDFCAIRIAYMMWARRYVAKSCPKEILYNESVEAVLCDVQSLPIPEECRDVILRLVEPTGKHLLSLLSLWIFAQPESSQGWLTGDILFECLILNADGLINQRKTAQKILSDIMLDNAIAFRLACINFLETEALKLWTIVKETFLKKLIQEGDLTNPDIRTSNWEAYLNRQNNMGLYLYRNRQSNRFDIHDYTYSQGPAPLSEGSWIKEREEVLFWISYCLSIENGKNIKDIPHFLRNDFDWYDFSLKFASVSGNVSCFDYFQTFCEYDPAEIIKRIFNSQEIPFILRKPNHLWFDRQLPCFIWHYMLLNPVVQEELFRKFPNNMLFFFLQWPLSLTFLDNIETLWDLVKDCVFKDMIELFKKNILRLPASNRLFNIPSFNKVTGIYSSEHLVRIWIALWNKSSEDFKSEFLNSVVFQDILSLHRTFNYEFMMSFENSGLQEKLFQLFLSNGQAILELLENEFLKESLRNLVTKYMPKHLVVLDRKCISFLENNSIMSRERKKNMHTYEKMHTAPVHYNFLDYLKIYFFSLNRN